MSERTEAAIHRVNQAGLLALCELPPIARQAYLLRLLPSSHDRPVRDAIEAVMMKNGPVVLPGMSITPVQIEQKLESIVEQVQETARRIENGEDPLFDQSMLQVTQSQEAPPKPSVPAPPTPMPETKIRFFCDHCQAALHAPPAQAGTRGKCPHCHERTPVPLRSTRVSGQKHPSETPGAGGAAKTGPKPTVVPTLAPVVDTESKPEDGTLDLAMSSYLDEREQYEEPGPSEQENEPPLVEPPVIDRDKVDQWKKVFGDSHAK